MFHCMLLVILYYKNGDLSQAKNRNKVLFTIMRIKGESIASQKESPASLIRTEKLSV